MSPASTCSSIPSGAANNIAISPGPKTTSISPEDNSGDPNNMTNNGSAHPNGSGASVKDLENAMSKHLPPTVAIDKTGSSGQLLHQPTDFSTDALLKQQQQRSTIQWIGAHHHHQHHLNQLNQLNHQHPQTPHGSPLPASALLRQLYASRESVIRANVHAASTGLSNGVVMSSKNSSSSPNYYSSSSGGGDANHVGPLPTPPGSEGSYGDQYSLPTSHNQKPTTVNETAFGSLVVPSYSATGGPVPGGPYSDYHSTMTPPSSVSPRDKHHVVHSNGAATSFDSSAIYNDVLRHQYLSSSATCTVSDGGGNLPSQPLPLKPQAYTPIHPTALDAYATATTGSPLDQSQFYHSSGFHIYHPSTNKPTPPNAPSSVYTESLKTPPNWYGSNTTPS